MKASRNIYKVTGAGSNSFFATRAEAVSFARKGLRLVSRVATKNLSEEDLLAFLAAEDSNAQFRAVCGYDFEIVE